MKYIILESRPDRLGSNITMYISQMLYAQHYGYYIKYDKTKLNYTKSPFVDYLLRCIDIYNSKLDGQPTEYASFLQGDWSQQIGGVTRLIQSDYISKFKDLYIGPVNNISPEYNLPYDPALSIVVHMRLDDVYHLQEINGSISANYYREVLNNDLPIIHENSPTCPNHQSPLSVNTIQKRIQILQEKYPGREVILVTNPGAKVDLPYRIICSADESYDLYLLCSAEVLLLSRSNFALSSLFFGAHTEVHVPLIGFLVMFGLSTKFDRSRYVYF